VLYRVPHVIDDATGTINEDTYDAISNMYLEAGCHFPMLEGSAPTKPAFENVIPYTGLGPMKDDMDANLLEKVTLANLARKKTLRETTPGHNVLVPPPMKNIGHVNALVHEAYGQCHELLNSADANQGKPADLHFTQAQRNECRDHSYRFMFSTCNFSTDYTYIELFYQWSFF
jgi:hypothetical protein